MSIMLGSVSLKSSSLSKHFQYLKKRASAIQFTDLSRSLEWPLNDLLKNIEMSINQDGKNSFNLNLYKSTVSILDTQLSIQGLLNDQIKLESVIKSLSADEQETVSDLFDFIDQLCTDLFSAESKKYIHIEASDKEKIAMDQTLIKNSKNIQKVLDKILGYEEEKAFGSGFLQKEAQAKKADTPAFVLPPPIKKEVHEISIKEQGFNWKLSSSSVDKNELSNLLEVIKDSGLFSNQKGSKQKIVINFNKYNGLLTVGIIRDDDIAPLQIQNLTFLHKKNENGQKVWKEAKSSGVKQLELIENLNSYDIVSDINKNNDFYKEYLEGLLSDIQKGRKRLSSILSLNKISPSYLTEPASFRGDNINTEDILGLVDKITNNADRSISITLNISPDTSKS